MGIPIRGILQTFRGGLFLRNFRWESRYPDLERNHVYPSTLTPAFRSSEIFAGMMIIVYIEIAKGFRAGWL